MNQPPTGYAASTYSFLWRRDLAAAIEELSSAGFAAIEVLAAPPHVSLPAEATAARQLRRTCESLGIKVNSVVPSGVDVNIASVDGAMRRWSVDQFVAAARLAAELDADHVIVHPGRRHPLRPPPPDMLHSWIVEGISRIVEMVTAEGVGALLENTPTGLLDTGWECRELVDRVGSERLGLCYDVANGHMVEDVMDGLRAASSRLRLVHVSDTTKHVWAHHPIGDGELDFAQIRELLEDLAYSGPVVIETLQPDGTGRGFVRDTARLRAAGWP